MRHLSLVNDKGIMVSSAASEHALNQLYTVSPVLSTVVACKHDMNLNWL